MLFSLGRLLPLPWRRHLAALGTGSSAAAAAAIFPNASCCWRFALGRLAGAPCFCRRATRLLLLLCSQRLLLQLRRRQRERQGLRHHQHGGGHRRRKGAGVYALQG